MGPSLHSALHQKSHYSVKARGLGELPAACRLYVPCFFATPWKLCCKMAVWFQEEPFSLYMLALPSEENCTKMTRSWAPYKHSFEHSVLQCPLTTLPAVENSLSHHLRNLFLSFSSRLLLWISQFVLTTVQLSARATLIRALLVYSLKSFHYFVQLVTLPLSLLRRASNQTSGASLLLFAAWRCEHIGLATNRAGATTLIKLVC